MAQIPAFLSSSTSVISTPAIFFVTAPTGSTLVSPTFLPFSIMYLTVSTLSTTGLVLGIQQTVVNPPFAAALLPVSISSLYVSPGSLKCTCKSINPGIT